MKSRALIAAAVCLVAASAVAADSALLIGARRAVSESVPQVAIEKLESFLAAGDLAPAERAAAQRELGAALFAAGQIDGALAAVQALADAGDPAALLLRADLFASGGRWTEALGIYNDVAARPAAPVSARLGAAECQVALGDGSAAIATLDALLRDAPDVTPARLRLVSLLIESGESARARAVLAPANAATVADEKWRLYLEGRLLLMEHQPEPALAAFETVRQRPEGVGEKLYFGATLGATDARIEMHGSDAADDVLEEFISRNPESAFLEIAFQRLDQIYAQEEHPSEGQLREWASDRSRKEHPRRAALARFHQARMQVRAKNPERAARSLVQAIEVYPDGPLVPAIRLMQADLLFQKGDLAAAVRAIEEAERHSSDEGQRAEIEMRKALVHYRQGEYLLAANSFRRAGERSAKLRQNATFDAALSALNQHNYDRFLADYQALSARAPESPMRSALLLEQGLAQARAGDARAAETLDLFIHHFPKHPRQGEARLALAELSFAAHDTGGAARYLRVVNEAPPEKDTSEHAAYLAIFLADAQAPRSDDDVIERARAFIREYPRSALLADVRMKLGQLYVRAGDHANAETQFTLLAQEQPAGPYAEAALFLGGQSAMKTINPGAVDRALALFDQVVKRDGPLKLYARQQQAIVQSKLGKESEAVVLYDAILAATPPPEPDLRSAALCGKGDNLLILGRKDPKQLEAAIIAFDQLAALPDASAAWRNQALYKKGLALKSLGRAPEALTAWYDVLDRTGPDGRDYFWYYKAGFDAAEFFKSQEQWKSAVGIYEKMAKLPGPRAGEAKDNASRLRLEKFLWE